MSAPAVVPGSTELPPELIAYTNSRSLMAQAGSNFALFALTVVLRCYARSALLKAFGPDDWTMLLAFALALATFICYALEVPQGLGRHLLVIQMNKDAYRELLKIRQSAPSQAGDEESLLSFPIGNHCLHDSIRYRIRWNSSTSNIIHLEIYLLTVAFVNIFSYISVRATWDTRLRPPPIGQGDAKCFSREVFAQIGLFNSIVNITTDFLLALLPVPLIWRLQLNIRTKFSLIAILSLGLFACVAGIMKATYNKTILTDIRRFIHDRYSMWNFIELDIGIIAASPPALKPLSGRFLDVARGLASGQKPSGFKDPKPLGYLERNDGSDDAGRSRTRRHTVRESVANFARSSAGSDHAPQGSEDSDLPLQDLSPKYNNVVVTTGITVERRRPST
ncbi:hypothetical protein EK21DRAFT_106337 [Setomelanomma holmii]|uniref:Rhodopsin domain-containing protein n=1 Tax=Setomelanomma holmii TaxID=210430 RepID=A0A9P4HKH6_9PLEO|nr:hypothetical protein EK21DRAFT_106337 [Setomelanomma holmii]